MRGFGSVIFVKARRIDVNEPVLRGYYVNLP